MSNRNAKGSRPRAVDENVRSIRNVFDDYSMVSLRAEEKFSAEQKIRLLEDEAERQLVLLEGLREKIDSSDSTSSRIGAANDKLSQMISDARVKAVTEAKDSRIDDLEREREYHKGQLQALTEDETFDTQAEGAQASEVIRRLRHQRDQARNRAAARLESLKRWHEVGREAGLELRRREKMVQTQNQEIEDLVRTIELLGGETALIRKTMAMDPVKDDDPEWLQEDLSFWDPGAEFEDEPVEE
ncbi:hypothetical protein BU16DRAFT_592122 [Lophium mytilinum]|uniref:Uncharacterized protein n=1 Tax=Lophium mytilinum TaxID=390894 RepID=A0A6A6QNH4_9PEZI|nr:hypothetical protein BU16DRAFT_592122 [Lophium mytilinum]